MNRIKSLNGYAIFQAGPRDVKKHGFSEGSFYVYFSSDVRDFGIANSTPEFEDCGSLEEAVAHCAGNFAIAKEIVEGRTTAASIEEILEVEAQLDAGADPDSLDDEELELDEPDGLTVEAVLTTRFPGMDPDTLDKIVDAAAGLHINPEAMQRILDAFDHVADVVKELAAKFVELLKPIAEAAAAIVRHFYGSVARCFVPAKWIHLSKHAKKARTRKKYRNRIRREIFAALASEGGGSS